MSVKERVLVGVGIVFGIVLIVILLIIFDGTPGGPIIVIEPGPEPNSKILNGCQSWPCWVIGCPEKYEVATSIGHEEPPKISHHFAGWVGVYQIAVNVKAGVTPTIDPTKIARIELTIGSLPLALEIKKQGAIPDWTFDGQELRGKYWRKEQDFPDALLKEITAIKVTGFDGSDLTPANGLDDVANIRIAFTRHFLYDDCD